MVAPYGINSIFSIVEVSGVVFFGEFLHMPCSFSQGIAVISHVMAQGGFFGEKTGEKTGNSRYVKLSEAKA